MNSDNVEFYKMCAVCINKESCCHQSCVLLNLRVLYISKWFYTVDYI